jgi:hypothetical protein
VLNAGTDRDNTDAGNDEEIAADSVPICVSVKVSRDDAIGG